MCINKGEIILIWCVSAIVNFYTMNFTRMQMNCSNVAAKSERMSLNHKSAFPVYSIKKLLVIH